MPRSATLLSLFVLLISAPLAAQTYPSLDNVTGEIARAATGGTQMVVVTNTSDYPVVVSDVTLQKCVNVRGVCGSRRLAGRVAQHAQAIVLKLVPISIKKEMTFEYSFEFKMEDPNSPTAIKAAKQADSARKANTLAANRKLEEMLKVAAAKGALSEEDYDSLVAAPKTLEVTVGETVDLTSAITLRARSASGKEIDVPRIQVLIGSGSDVLSLNGGTIRGLKPGEAVLKFSLGIAAGDSTSSGKGIVSVPVKVVP